MTISILALSLILVSILCLTFMYKYKKLDKKVSIIIKDLEKPLRRGYYKMHCTQGSISGSITYEPIIFVKELDRYTTGDSKIELESIEISCGDHKFSASSSERFVRKEFQSLVKTSDIIWLDSEFSIKEQRKEKLSHLKEIIK